MKVKIGYIDINWNEGPCYYIFSNISLIVEWFIILYQLFLDMPLWFFKIMDCLYLVAEFLC